MVLEKMICFRLLPYMGMAAILVMCLDKIYNLTFPFCLEAAYEIKLKWAQ